MPSLRAIERVFIVLTIVAVEATTLWGVDSFPVHTCIVTAGLLVETYALTQMYRGGVRMPPQLDMLTKIVFAGGVLHNVTPFVMTFVHSSAVYVHLPICFSVHCLHMLHVTSVFKDCGVEDRLHVGVLLFINVMEMATNVAVLDDDVYPHVARATEIVLLMMWTVAVKPKRTAPTAMSTAPRAARSSKVAVSATSSSS